MSEQEHKKWRMLKVANKDKIIKFEGDIAPAMSSNKTGTNEYGIWGCNCTGYWDYDSGQDYYIFDKNKSTYRRGIDSTVNNKYFYAELILPDGCYIELEEFIVNCERTGEANFVYKIQGSVDGGAYEDITDIIGFPPAYAKRDVATTISVPSKYYNKFRLVIYNKSFATIASYAYIYEFKLTKGTLKIINN